MIRVMQINQGEKFGGVSSMLFHLYQHIDRQQVQFDFVAPRKSSFSTCRSEIEEMGGRIFELKAGGSFIMKKLRFWKRLKDHINKERYEIVHINSGSILFNIQCALVARACHVRKIIVHSHNAGADGDMKQKLAQLCKPLLDIAATDFLACSHKAAQFMYVPRRIREKKYMVINNGVDTEQFAFSQSVRDEYRAELGISNDTEVILHVGRFSRQKNHSYLVRLFKKYTRKYPKSVLLLVGAGDLSDSIKELVKKLGIEDKVKFLGLRSDIPSLMAASDVFLLPSLYEGLPVVGIEAQTSGLPCIFADTITKEVDVLRNNCFISLEADADKWCDRIHAAASSRKDRESAAAKISAKGYSIQASAKTLLDCYLSR